MVCCSRLQTGNQVYVARVSLGVRVDFPASTSNLDLFGIQYAGQVDWAKTQTHQGKVASYKVLVSQLNKLTLMALHWCCIVISL